MRKIVFIAAWCLAPGWALGTSSTARQIPKGARLYKETTAVLVPGGKQVKVVFWSEEMKSAGVSVLASDGNQIASASLDLPHGLTEPTGLYHLHRDESTQIVLFGRVGAKAALARVYALEGQTLLQQFDWSGWDFQIITLRGGTLLATREFSHGVVTDLYQWRDNRFTKVNELFPEFYARNVEQQEKFIREAYGRFASQFAEACRIIAQELLYNRKYMNAKDECQQALVAVRSRCCSGSSSVNPDVASDDKNKAEERIIQTISEIEAAQKAGSTALALVLNRLHRIAKCTAYSNEAY